MKCAACGYDNSVEYALSLSQYEEFERFDNVRDVNLYACPKCGTVKVEPELMEE